VVAAQRRLALAGASVEAAELTAGAVTERVKAGKEPPLQAAKASVEVALARLQHETEGNVLMAARTRLAAMWGQAAGFGDAEDTLDDELAEPENLERLRTRLTATPEWAREDQKIRLREAALASEMAARVPDLDVAAGVQRFEEDGTDAMTLGVALSLPLFDRNRYTIASARHELERARAEQHAAKLALQAGLADAHTELVTARGRARTLREQVVPTMEQAFAAAQEGYRQGKFDFLDVLDAQRGLFKAGTSLVNALADYYDARAEIERITAGSLDALIEGRHMEDRR
jgi:cobalt-zinc-cadmium efflux system outer membrane protein